MKTIAAAILVFALSAVGGGIARIAAPPARSAVVVGAVPRAAARDAQSIVRALEARYHSVFTLKAAFIERYSERRHDLRIESGTVYFRRPGRMRWEYESPEEKLFVADGKMVWFYVPADRTVTRARMKESTDWRTPLALLTGKAKVSRLCRRVELADADPAGAGLALGHVVLRCLPRGASAATKSGSRTGLRDDAARAQSAEPDGALEPGGNDSVREVFLEVEAGTGELARVLIRFAGDVEIEYRFGNWRRNVPLPEAMFHFRAPLGVAIADESSISSASH